MEVVRVVSLRVVAFENQGPRSLVIPVRPPPCCPGGCQNGCQKTPRGAPAKAGLRSVGGTHRTTARIFSIQAMEWPDRSGAKHAEAEVVAHIMPRAA